MKWKEIIELAESATDVDDLDSLINSIEEKHAEIKNKMIIVDVEVQKISRIFALLSVPPAEFDCLVDSINKIKKTCEEVREPEVKSANNSKG